MTHRIRVRYAETDQMGVAHHAAYVIWLEEARIAWLHARGISYRDLEASGLLMPVVDLRITYRKPVRFDDELDLETSSTSPGSTRLTFTTTVRLAGVVCAEASVTVAAVDRTGQPCRMPASVISAG
jgi:acyl-CoA thioester hydrolase